MGGGGSRIVHIYHDPDPALVKQMNDLMAEIGRQNADLERAQREGAQATAESNRIRAAVTELKRQQAALQQRLAEEQNRYEQLLVQYRRDTEAAQRKLESMSNELSKLDISSIDDLERADKVRFDSILQLCAALPPLPLQGRNIGFFGLTSVGKSSLINAFLGEKVCQVGRGETTMEMAPYRKRNSSDTFWDIPGRNDRICYLSAEFVGTLKSMAFVGIMVQSTAKEMTKIMDVLAFLRLNFHLIVNHIDIVEEEDKTSDRAIVNNFKAKIRGEITGNPFCRGIYFISAKKQSGDWQELRNAVNG